MEFSMCIDSSVVCDPLAPQKAYRHRERVAWRKLGSPDHFHFYAWRCDDADAVELTGCVITRLVTKGRRAGRPDYKSGAAKRVTVTESEVLAERRMFESETGKCGECLGEGQTVHRVDFVNNKVDYRSCRVCEGSGLARYRSDGEVL